MRSTCNSRGRKQIEGRVRLPRFQIAFLDARKQTVGNLRAQIDSSARHHAQGFQQIHVRGALQNEGARAGANGAHHRVFVVVHREDNDLAFAVKAQDFLRGFDAVQSRQADIHQHQMRAKALGELHRVGAVLRFADDAKFVAAAQDRLNAVAHDLMIIHEEDVERHNG